MKPSVGRIVHYRGTINTECRAALVVAVNSDGTTNLMVFDPHGTSAAPATGVAEGSEGDAWHWPERVE